MQTSSLFSLDVRDLGKGLLIAAGSAVVASIQGTLSAGTFTFDWKAIGGVALASGVAYLTKNFLTGSQIITPVK